MKKASTSRPTGRDGITRLVDVPNVGPAVAADLRRLGITSPGELSGHDPYAMFDDLCRLTGQRHDPCLLDTFTAAVSYANGGAARPWWEFSRERKARQAAGQAG